MITDQLVVKNISQLEEILEVSMLAVDPDINMIAGNEKMTPELSRLLEIFLQNDATIQKAEGYVFGRVVDGNETLYVIAARDANAGVQAVKLAMAGLSALVEAYVEKYDKNGFYQNLILDNLLMVDIYNRAKKLGIIGSRRRCVFTLQLFSKKDVDLKAMEILRMFMKNEGGGEEDFVTSVEEGNIVIIRNLEEGEEYEELSELAKSIISLLESELMTEAKLSYGTIVQELKDVSRSYKESKMALDVGRIFYPEKKLLPYNTLGIGRLIYQLPLSLCELFMKEVFGDRIPDNLDEETLTTIDKFFENNLNVSETARQLYVHRNTLVYRLEKLMRTTGLDIRNFEDALTFKIALMVICYIKDAK